MYALPSQCIPIHNQMKKVMLLLFLRICDDSEVYFNCISFILD